jgi:hypothetical protein
MRIAWLVLLAASFMITAASAGPPRYARPERAPERVTLSPRVKPRPPVVMPPAAPVVTADQVLAAHARAEPLRREQEALLERLARDTPDEEPEKPEIVLRLAEHYAQQLRFWRLRATELTLRAR